MTADELRAKIAEVDGQLNGLQMNFANLTGRRQVYEEMLAVLEAPPEPKGKRDGDPKATG